MLFGRSAADSRRAQSVVPDSRGVRREARRRGAGDGPVLDLQRQLGELSGSNRWEPRVFARRIDRASCDFDGQAAADLQGPETAAEPPGYEYFHTYAEVKADLDAALEVAGEGLPGDLELLASLVADDELLESLLKTTGMENRRAASPVNSA